MTVSTKQVGYPGLAWRGPIVTVAFNGGNPATYPLIEQAAQEWTAYGGKIRLSFRTSSGAYRMWRETDTAPVADIRIGFFRDQNRDGYWSTVGLLARRILPNAATMNYGDLAQRLTAYVGPGTQPAFLASYDHTVILHEFGHALGLAHEHFHPQCQVDMKLTDAVNSLMGPPNNWSRAQAEYNMVASVYLASMASQPGTGPADISPTIDKASVMLYSFNDSFYESGAESACRPSGPMHYATALSVGDRQYYGKYYGP